MTKHPTRDSHEKRVDGCTRNRCLAAPSESRERDNNTVRIRFTERKRKSKCLPEVQRPSYQCQHPTRSARFAFRSLAVHTNSPIETEFHMLSLSQELKHDLRHSTHLCAHPIRSTPDRTAKAYLLSDLPAQLSEFQSAPPSHLF